MAHELLISNRTRTTPFTSRVEACGVKAYTVYNHMLLPAVFRGLEEDYWHLCEAVQSVSYTHLTLPTILLV